MINQRLTLKNCIFGFPSCWLHMSLKSHLRIALVISLFQAIQPTFSQTASDSSGGISTGVDLVSQYLWRGMVLSPGPAIQPFMEVSLHNFRLGAEGSIALRPFAWQEIDLYLEYEYKWMTLALNDYFVFNDSSFQSAYFDYKEHSTLHVLEATVSFDGTEKIPFRFLAGYNFFGDDPTRSLYFEGAWMKEMPEGALEVFAGYTPHNGYYHASRKGFTHIGASFTRNLISSDKLTMPFQVTLQYMPLIQQTILTASIGIY